MDKDLINRVIDGDKKSEENFYCQCKLKVKSYLMYNYKKTSEIDDDVSEIIIKIYQNLKKYDAEKSEFETWIINITKNYMIDKYRKNDKCYTISMNDFNYQNDATSSYTITRSSADNKNVLHIDIPDTIPNQEQNLVNKDTAVTISSCIGSANYNLLTMKYVEGYSYDEIAMEHGLTSTTASNKVNYIKTKLKNDK